MGEPKENDPVTRTFRIEHKYDEALREEAEKRGTSVNSLANQILKRFSESSRYFGRGQSMGRGFNYDTEEIQQFRDDRQAERQEERSQV